MKKLLKGLEIFTIGGVSYGLIEILWRKYTHWTMVLTGGVCFSVLYRLYDKKQDCSMLKKCVMGSAVITSIEFITGFVVNMLLKMKVWDYSKMPLNVFGQVCAVYSFLWGLLSIPIELVCKGLRKKISA